MYQGGGGMGNCWEDFKITHPEISEEKVEKLTVKINIYPDLKTAFYKYDYSIKFLEDTNSTFWWFIVPHPIHYIERLNAYNNTGPLEAEKEEESESRTKIKIYYRGRKRRKRGDVEHIQFEFEAPSDVILMNGFIKQSAVFIGFVEHNVHVERFSIELTLPENVSVFDSYPPTRTDSNPIRYEARNRIPLDYFVYYLAFKKQRIGRSFIINVSALTMSSVIATLLRTITDISPIIFVPLLLAFFAYLLFAYHRATE